MINDLFNNALTTLDRFANAIDKFDFDAAIDNINKKSSAFFTGLNDYATNVRNNLSDFKVFVHFDKSKDSLSWHYDNGILSITTASNDGSAKSSVNTTIPENANIDKMYRKYDKKNHVVTFVIPKEKTIEALKDEKIQKLVDDYKTKFAELQDKFKADVEKVKEDPSVKKAVKQCRDAKGRFIANVKNKSEKEE